MRQGPFFQFRAQRGLPGALVLLWFLPLQADKANLAALLLKPAIPKDAPTCDGVLCPQVMLQTGITDLHLLC